jgi:chaperonin GroES
MLKPLADRLIVKRATQELKTESGIVLPESAKEKPEQGTVLAVGKKVEEVKKGDTIIFAKYGPAEVKYNGEELLIVKEEDVLAVTDK